MIIVPIRYSYSFRKSSLYSNLIKLGYTPVNLKSHSIFNNGYNEVYYLKTILQEYPKVIVIPDKKSNDRVYVKLVEVILKNKMEFKVALSSSNNFKMTKKNDFYVEVPTLRAKIFDKISKVSYKVNNFNEFLRIYYSNILYLSLKGVLNYDNITFSK